MLKLSHVTQTVDFFEQSQWETGEKYRHKGQCLGSKQQWQFMT